MDGRRLKVLNSVDDYSRLCPAIHVGKHCKVVDVIDTIVELLKLYPEPTNLRIDDSLGLPRL
jgi:putative transposase